MSQKRQRRPPRQQQQQHTAEQSDYDSEAFQTSHTPSAHVQATSVPAPAPAPRSIEEINLAVLQRYNPQIRQILRVAPFATVYLFSPTGEWTKAGIEGTLFVTELTPTIVSRGPGEEDLAVERYSVTVLNRKGLQNFGCELHTSADVEVTEQYVILQINGRGGQEAEHEEAGIFALWIFSEKGSSTEHSKDVTAAVMVECAARSQQSRERASQAIGAHVEALEEFETAQEDAPSTEQYDSHVEHPAAPQPPPQQQHRIWHNDAHQAPPQHFADPPYGWDQPQQYTAPPPATGQRLDLLSLFGSAPQPVVHNDFPPQHAVHNGFAPLHHNGWDLAPGRPDSQQGYLPHAHPQPGPPPTQAQSLLNLFRSG